MTRVAWFGVLIVSLIPSRLLPAQDGGQWRVTADEVRLACLAARRDSEAPPAALKRLCGLPLGRWGEWAPDNLPSGDVVVAWARRGLALAPTAAGLAEQRPPAGPTQITVQAGPAAVPGAAPALTQAAIILGLTDFLIERTEVQIQSWLLPRMFHRICRVVPPDTSRSRTADSSLRWLLPETCLVLEHSAPRGLSNSARSVYAAILADMRAMPAGLIGRLAPHPDSLRSADDSTRLVAGQLALALSHVVVSVARNPGSLTEALPRAAAMLPGPGWDNAHRVARLLTGVSAALEAEDLPADPVSWVNALRAVWVNEGGDFASLPGDGVDSLLSRVERVRLHVLGAQQAFADLRGRGEPRRDEDPAARRERVNQYAALLTHVVDGLLTAATIESDPRVARMIEPAARAVVAVEVGDFAAAVGAAASLARLAGDRAAFGPEAVRILGFAADVSQATTPEDVTEALRGFANAAGARAPKRSDAHGWLLGVQAYGGFSAGLEFLDVDTTAAENLDPAMLAGLHFPLGFEVTFDRSRFGLFLQILDLGTIASARIVGSGDAEAGPEIGFAQVVAPGLFLTFAIPETPLSVGLGGAFAPKLRALRAGQDDQRNAVRFAAFLALDIGIFP